MDAEKLNELLSNMMEKQDGQFYALTAAVAGTLDVSSGFRVYVSTGNASVKISRFIFSPRSLNIVPI